MRNLSVAFMSTLFMGSAHTRQGYLPCTSQGFTTLDPNQKFMETYVCT